tara:strand:+ start:4793 stop:4921 length:129 start_codon:yes stop_codon:yes gene_type:complete
MQEIKESIIEQIVKLKLLKPQTQEIKLKIQKLQQLLSKDVGN